MAGAVGSSSSAGPATTTPDKPKAKLSNKERAALESLPGQIEALETTLTHIQSRLADPMLYKQDPESVPKLQSQLESLEADLLKAMDQWDQLLQKESGLTT
ncbi:MAG: ABC transporter C-terminal domain-containing protein, partial [Burkholderiaceae bacterium]